MVTMRDPLSVEVIYDRRPASPPEISFLVPAYNERPRIDIILRRLLELPFSKEVIVVDDGSTDGTRELLSAAPRDGLCVLFHPMNAGKGAAIQTALEKARGVYAAIQDADLEYDPGEYAGLLEILRQKKVGVVFGSRFLKDNPTRYRRYLLGNKLITLFTNLICRSHFTDTYTCYKLMGTETLRSLNLLSGGFEMESEICVKVALRGLPYAEGPISYSPRTIEEGKKIGWMDGVKGLATVVRLWWKERFRPVLPR
jgi:dolichol-phosphate mannosyltransferase